MKALPIYDFCITTKSFEIKEYKQKGVRNVLFCTQGYDPSLHKSYHDFKDKKGVVFIGHKEDDREEALTLLLEKNIPVKLAGLYWGKFAFKYRNNKNLIYLGKGLYGNNYSKTISGSSIGLGFLSKFIPEKHTTRTFEIPACGTALMTEKTDEIASFFKDDEVMFFKEISEIPDQVQYALAHPEILKEVTIKAQNKVQNQGYDYPTILKRVLEQINFLK